MNNKKIKVISSVAVAGLLTLNVFSANALVAQAKEVDDTVSATRPLGVYRSLISGENTAVAPVVVQKDKATFADDYVTVDELVNSDKISTITAFNGQNINSVSRKEMVKTGDTITISGGETVTVVVYGDVNKDGLVDGDDASEILKYDVGAREFDSIEKLAADVKNYGNNKGTVDGDDASHILKYDVGMEKVIEVEPTAEEANYKYTIEVNGNNIVNNRNLKKSVVTIKLPDSTEEVKGLTLVAEDSEGTEIEIVKNVPTIPAHTTQMPVNDVDLEALVDGNITVYLKNGDEIVGTVKVVKNTVAPTVANVLTVRTTSRKATLSLEAYGESDIAKVYYIVNTATDITTITAPTVEKLMESGNVINVTGNKVTDYEVANNLEEKKAAVIWYVVENSNGSINDTTPLKAIISNDKAMKEDAIEEITIPDLTKGETEFSWTASGKKVVYNVLKDGKIILSDEKDNDDGKIDVADLITEEGKYKVTVKVKGLDNGGTADSDIITSEEVTVSKLQEVTNLKLEIIDKKAKLTWTNPNKVEDFKECAIQLYKLKKDDANGEIISEEVGTPVKVSNNAKPEAEIVVDSTNTVYFAKVQLIADNTTQKAIISSDETKSNEAYIVDTVLMAPKDAKKITSNSITLNVNPLEIVGRTVSNKIEVYTVNDTDGTDVKYVKTGKNVELSKDDTSIVVDGLENNKKYAFRLVAVVDGTEEVKSDFSATIRTYATMPTISNLTVTKDYNKALEANSGKIAVDGSKIAINGTEYLSSGEDFKGTSLVRNTGIVAALEEGDVVTIEEDTVTLELNDNESKREFATSIKGMDQVTLNVTSNEFAKTLIGKVKELSLSGNGAIYNVSGITSTNNIVLNSGVEVVQSNKKFTLSSKATNVIINKVAVSTQQQTEIISLATGLNVTANTSSNVLTFSNMNGVADTIISFVGLANNTSVQAGTININSNVEGKTMTLRSNTANKVNISANVNVVAKAGTVDLAEQTLNGAKSVNVTKAKEAEVTVNFLAKTKAPKALNGFNIDATDDEIKEELDIVKEVDDGTGTGTKKEVVKEDSELSDVEKEKIVQLKTYLSSFGLNGKGAKIKNNATTNITTITFDGDTIVNTTIGNIQ